MTRKIRKILFSFTNHLSLPICEDTWTVQSTCTSNQSTCTSNQTESCTLFSQYHWKWNKTTTKTSQLKYKTRHVLSLSTITLQSQGLWKWSLFPSWEEWRWGWGWTVCVWRVEGWVGRGLGGGGQCEEQGIGTVLSGDAPFPTTALVTPKTATLFMIHWYLGSIQWLKTAYTWSDSASSWCYTASAEEMER